MDEYTLSNILHTSVKDTEGYLGIYTKDNFFDFDIMKYKYCCLVLFIDNISKNLGHWCVIIKIRNNIYFLDSFALHPMQYGIDLKNMNNSKNLGFYYLTQRTQNNETTTCGAFAIYYIISIIKCKYKIKCFVNKFNQRFFESDYQNNEKTIINYLTKKFPKYVNEKNCSSLFCNSEFIINRRTCLKKLCKVSGKVSRV